MKLPAIVLLAAVVAKPCLFFLHIAWPASCSIGRRQCYVKVPLLGWVELFSSAKERDLPFFWELVAIPPKLNGFFDPYAWLANASAPWPTHVVAHIELVSFLHHACPFDLVGVQFVHHCANESLATSAEFEVASAVASEVLAENVPLLWVDCTAHREACLRLNIRANAFRLYGSHINAVTLGGHFPSATEFRHALLKALSSALPASASLAADAGAEVELTQTVPLETGVNLKRQVATSNEQTDDDGEIDVARVELSWHSGVMPEDRQLLWYLIVARLLGDMSFYATRRPSVEEASPHSDSMLEIVVRGLKEITQVRLPLGSNTDLGETCRMLERIFDQALARPQQSLWILHFCLSALFSVIFLAMLVQICFRRRYPKHVDSTAADTSSPDSAPNVAPAVGDSASCHVCLNLLVNPVTSGCGHTVCRACYKQMLLCIETPKCFCGKSLDPVVPAPTVSLRNIIAGTYPEQIAELEKKMLLEEAELDERLCCVGGYEPGARVLARVSRATLSLPADAGVDGNDAGEGAADVAGDGDRRQAQRRTFRFRRGEEGIVLGPTLGSARRNELRVRFPDYPEATVSLNDICRPLPNGFRPGDEVISLIDFQWPEGRSLMIGDVGEVLGPAAGDTALDVSSQVLCKFPNNDSVNVFTSQIKAKGIVGGYRVGDRVIVLQSSGGVQEGEEGLVLDTAPASPEGEDCVLCGFRGHRDLVVRLNDICPYLPGGYKTGDQVVSLINFQWPGGKSLAYGDVGEILGPATQGVAFDSQNQVLCKFPNNPSVNVFIGQIRRKIAAVRQE